MKPFRSRAAAYVIPILALFLFCGACGALPDRADSAHELPSGLMARSASAYLRTAAASPVEWQEYDDTAFALARRLDRPLLLDVGASWCHWCHVMDRENYDNAEIAAIINRLFVPVKIDRDLHADLDARYQAASQALGGGGGWPLTVVITPHGDAVWSATFVPPDRFREMLPKIREWYDANKSRISADPGFLLRAIAESENRFAESGPVNENVIKVITDAIERNFDPEYGGWGEGVKFANSGAVDLALIEAGVSSPMAEVSGPMAGVSGPMGRRRDREELLRVATVTLEKMRRSGVFDQLGGGFHRYGVDRAWRVPHFEKMLYDNAGALGNGANLFRATGDPQWKTMSYDIIRWSRGVMIDSRGGFYASQDADFSSNDDGDYFTWTATEAKAEIDPEEWRVAERYWDIAAAGEMHENPARNVLYVAEEIAATARALRISESEARRRLESAKIKLFAARGRRPTPKVDPTIYPNWNGMMISAYLSAWRAFGDVTLKADALAAVKRLLKDAYVPGRGFVRALTGPYFAPTGAAGGYLDDQAQMMSALLDAYSATSDSKWLTVAKDIADHVLPRFRDEASGALFDIPIPSEMSAALPGLGMRLRRIEDNPTPAPTCVAARALVRLAVITGDSRYRNQAEQMLRAISGSAKKLGTSAASMGLAIEELLHPTCANEYSRSSEFRNPSSRKRHVLPRRGRS